MTVVTRDGAEDAAVHTFARGNVGLVSLPSPDACDLELDQHSAHELLDLTKMEQAVTPVIVVSGIRLEIADDPAALVMADDGTLVTRQRYVPASLVYDPRIEVLNMLRNEVSADEWTRGGGDIADSQRVGALAGGVLVALASVEKPVGRIARLRVVVAPSHRRRGFGRLVLVTLASKVIKQGLLPYCRLALGDLTARALATAVGFVTFARSLTLRAVAVRDEGGVEREAVLR